MRKPRDIDAELKALQDKQKQLRAKRTTQLGELVIATGAAEALSLESLAGVLLDAIEKAKADASAKEAWRRKGESFFRRERRSAKANGAGGVAAGVASDLGGPAPVDRGAATG